MNEFFIKIFSSTTRFCGSFLEKMEWQKWSNKTIVNLPSGLINELFFYYSLFLWISGNLSFISWLKLWSFLFLPFWRNSCFCKKWQSTALRRFQNKAVYLIFSLQMTQLPGNHSKSGPWEPLLPLAWTIVHFDTKLNFHESLMRALYCLRLVLKLSMLLTPSPFLFRTAVQILIKS